MTIRVRFAPSPTGLLHIGGARTALYSYLFAKAKNGKFILRIEDTDLERSTKDSEIKMIDDLNWCGITWDEGPDNGGEYGPYRQSERKEIYKKYAFDLIESGHAYPCFLTTSELEKLTEQANTEKKAPHIYHGKYRDLPKAEAKKKMDAGDEYVIRFKNPQKKYTLNDIVRGNVTYNEDMVGDFVILRSNEMPTFNFCCAIDDHLMKISHVIRAEEHLNNTVRQLMIYESLGVKPPEFAHVSLLVGEDRQKLSKRHGATSVAQYREQHYLPEALMNYLLLLGWSHPEEKDIFSLDEVANIFDLTRFSKSPALYDIKKLNYFNEQHLRKLTTEQLIMNFDQVVCSTSPYHQQSIEWKNSLADLFRDKIQIFSDIEEHLKSIFSNVIEKNDEYKEILSWETTLKISQYLDAQLENTTDRVTSVQMQEWMDYLKKELKIKGRPLFMGTRVVLTGQGHGPDLNKLVPLIPIENIKKNVKTSLT
ncbi:MAG: glutamate--tRNA ligase [Halobacteriovoraceae bacterium]|nr:glutamate--tRNA ligase [Halobacteriovoraceae bacterium]